MKILHLCGGSASGGAAKGALNLHRSLLKTGVDSKVLFSMKGNEPSGLHEGTFFKKNIINITAKKVIPRIESTVIRMSAGKKVWPYSLGIVGYPFLEKNKWLRQADIIHLHWINASFVSIAQIKNLNKPIVWTIRDEWPYTGGCHYAGECTRFMQSCGKCPLLDSKKDHDISRKTFLRKEKLDSKKIQYIAISSWIADRAKKSSLLNNQSVSVILNGIDEVFLDDELPIDKEIFRRDFGLLCNEKLLLCGATSLDSPYKGYSVLERFKPVPGLNYRIVTFGSISESMKSKIKVPATHLGNIASTKELKKLYCACDVFLGPSHMEAFGKTLAEASACGLPVVAYNHGGPKDIVLDSVSGILIEPFNEFDYVKSTIKLCKDEVNLLRMGANAKSTATSLFDSKKLSCQYAQIYRKILNNE